MKLCLSSQTRIADFDRAPPTAPAPPRLSPAPTAPRSTHKETQREVSWILKPSARLHQAPTMCVADPGDTDTPAHPLVLKCSVCRRNDQGGRAKWGNTHPRKGPRRKAHTSCRHSPPTAHKGESPSSTWIPSHTPNVVTRCLGSLSSARALAVAHHSGLGNCPLEHV